MKAVQYLLLAVMIVAAIVCVIFGITYLPIEPEILPAWITERLPPSGTAAMGWLIFAIIAVMVLSALAVAVVQRTIDRRSPMI